MFSRIEYQRSKKKLQIDIFKLNFPFFIKLCESINNLK